MVAEKSFTSPTQLFNFLELSTPPSYFDSKAQELFKFLVPLSFAQRIIKNNPNDPLLLQILPHLNESVEYPGFTNDPIIESAHTNNVGLLQKYQHRLLLMPTSACGIHCRYCFRRHFPYHDIGFNSDLLIQQIELIEQTQEITEIILSGGDPLCLNDKKLSSLFSKLVKISHLKRVRIHTRQLIVEPQRISKKLISLLKNFPLPIAIVLHCNHPNELNGEVKRQLQRLKSNNIQLLNQSVLLKGVNDCANTLSDLSEKLYQFGILPYYLHQLDPVAGSQHFFVGDTEAIALLHQIKKTLPGYLVPKLVREVSGKPYKILLA